MKFIARFRGARHTAALHLKAARLSFAAAPTVNGGETRSLLFNQSERTISITLRLFASFVSLPVC